jgi:glutamate dehydrogenase
MLVKKGIVKSKQERDGILLEMTEEVAALVLADNENQSRALSLDALRSAARYEDFVNLLDEMRAGGILGHLNSGIPTRKELMQNSRKERGLPKPLLADLLGYVKMWGYDRVLHSELPDHELALPFLQAYFPIRMREGFSEHFEEHPLRREIIATAVVNYVVNNGGISLLPRMVSVSKKELSEVVEAYLSADREMDAASRRKRVLEDGLTADAEHEELLKIEASLESSALHRLFGKTGQ